MLEQLEQEIINCSLCNRLRKVTPIPYPHIFYGDLKDIKVMAIGRNPGLEHDYTNVEYKEFMKIYHDRWWNCRVGNYLKKRFGEEFVKKYMFFTNVCKCSSPENTLLYPSEKEKCLPFLQRQIDVIKPKVILTFSSEAKTVLSNKVKDHMYYTSEDNGIPIFSMYHPSYFRFAKDSKNKSKKQDLIIESILKKI